MGTTTGMRTFLRQHVLGLVAIFIALGGTALALPGTNTVNSGDIVNGTVKEADLHDQAWHIVQTNPGDPFDPCGGSNPEDGIFCGSISPEGDIVRWRNYNGGYEGARFSRDAVGQVHLEGLVKQQTSGNGTALDQTTIFRLPPGYRPAAALLFPVDCAAVAGVTHGRLDVTKTGSVVWQAYDECVTGAYLSLSGIDFKAEQ